MKTAIIGSGISGLGTAYLITPDRDVTIFEKNAYIGGHSRTISININGQSVSVDTGFIVCNNWNYPNLMGMFDMLGVAYVKSNMSFGVSIGNGWLEYASGDLFALQNIIRPSYWRMLYHILKFNKSALRYLEKNPSVSLGEVLSALKMGDWFKNYYLLAMGAAIWSCPVQTILKFPASTFIRFFKNHGLLSIKNRPQWYTVQGGSKQYINRLIKSFKDNIHLNCGIVSAVQKNNIWILTDTHGDTHTFEQVVFACHADEAMHILGKSAPNHTQPINNFSYQENKIVVHSDTSFLPKNKKCWASWVYVSEHQTDTKPVVSLSYYMNNLQPLNTDTPIIITLNPGRLPQSDLIYDTHTFSHPIFDYSAVSAQPQIADLQGINGLWFCGAYQRYGFHEDGLLSAVHIVQKMGGKIPWQ